MYFDTHAHYDSSKFSVDRDEVIRAVYESGVSLIVDPGDTLERSADVVALANQYDFVYAAVGVHPEEYETWADDTVDRLRELAKNPKVRLCVSAIALETLSAALAVFAARGLDAEVTQIAVSRARPGARLHLLLANNPVFLVTACGGTRT